MAYVAHLLLLYGTPVTPNLASSFGKSLGLASASQACALIMAATLGIMWLWHWLERE